MTAINSQPRSAYKVDFVIEPVPVQKRGLARRRPEDVQEEVRD
jgi:hypothetical protein